MGICSYALDQDLGLGLGTAYSALTPLGQCGAFCGQVWALAARV